MIGALIEEIEAAQPGVQWGVSVRVGTERAAESRRADRPLETASVGKLLLLIALAERIQTGEIDAHERLARHTVAPVADSGLWQHLSQEDLAVSDLAALVGSVSDNLATNVLIERVGLDTVDATRRRLSLEVTRLLDIVRDERTDADPEATSVGSAVELRGLFERLRAERSREEPVAESVTNWLCPACDLSMVASAFNLDPLAHAVEDRDVVLVNKTGTTQRVRADAGFVEGPGGHATYAAVANWPQGQDHRDEVMAAMRSLGEAIRGAVGP